MPDLVALYQLIGNLEAAASATASASVVNIAFLIRIAFAAHRIILPLPLLLARIILPVAACALNIATAQCRTRHTLGFPRPLRPSRSQASLYHKRCKFDLVER